jgi:hypothetical protein
MLGRLKEVTKRQLGYASRLKFALESILAVAGVIALALAAWHHFAPDRPAPAPGEGKRVVAFRQVANRICTENHGHMQVALKEGRSTLERLGYVARALGWDLNDLETITAPPVKFEGFLEEVAVRQRIRDSLLALQQAIELGDREDTAIAVGEIESLGIESREISRETGIVRCMTVVPNTHELLEPLQQKTR